MKCQACEEGDHQNCGMQTWCECDCDGPEAVDFGPLPFERKAGPVEILCKEIDFQFNRSMEATTILVAFVEQLVRQVADAREMEVAISGVTGRAPSDASAEALRLAIEMIDTNQPPVILIERAAKLHAFDDTVNPDDGPCDHIVDMLNSCASAIRFGLETPCRSRHAASAAQHIWRKRYGISLEDDITPHWSKHWARIQLQRAITDLALKTA